MKLFHAADIHLGRRRLEGRLPDQDLADAFLHVARQAIQEQADVFLIAGDLFDRAQVEPTHLRQAQQVLAELKKAAIPVVAIEGNHDKAFIHSENPTWLNYLAEDDLLMLLRTRFNASGALVEPWDPVRKCGSFVDLKGVRFIGAGYLGAATPHKVREIVAALDSDQPQVLLLHAGPEYFVGEAGGFSSADLVAIRQRICYLALGHIHKPMRHEDWACNPGSLENCDVAEAATPGPRGYAVIEIDPSRPQKPVSLEIRDNPRRPCVRLELDCTAFGNKLKNGAQALVDAAVDLIQAKLVAPQAFIDLRLNGRLNLDRIALDQRSACAEIEKAAGVQAVAFDLTCLNIDAGLIAGRESMLEEVTREALEKAAITRLVNAENLWGLEGRQEAFASLFYELKEAVRAGKSSAELADRISQSPLVESVQKALEEQAQREPRDQRDKWKATGETAAKGFDTMVQVAEAQTELAKSG